jgi:3-methyl-2-oxobutanoate hydroxymethyltransferase
MPAHTKTNVQTLRDRKAAGRKFPVLTCYDHPTARIMADAGVDVLLVGDTAAQVILGYDDTRAASLDYMIEITAAVRRGAPNALLIGDMPYAAGYRDDPAAGVDAARRFVDDAGTDLVKIEMHRDYVTVLEAITAAGIDTIAHIGLRPQYLAEHGGYKGQAKTAAAARALIDEARIMQDAGATVLLLESVAHEVSAEITARTPLPVIGCVAGPACDGTVVVLHDMLGWGGGQVPRSVKQYINLRAVLADAFRRYHDDVIAGRFPPLDRAFGMNPGEYEKLKAQLGSDEC